MQDAISSQVPLTSGPIASVGTADATGEAGAASPFSALLALLPTFTQASQSPAFPSDTAAVKAEAVNRLVPTAEATDLRRSLQWLAGLLQADAVALPASSHRESAQGDSDSHRDDSNQEATLNPAVHPEQAQDLLQAAAQALMHGRLPPQALREQIERGLSDQRQTITNPQALTTALASTAASTLAVGPAPGQDANNHSIEPKPDRPRLATALDVASAVATPALPANQDRYAALLKHPADLQTLAAATPATTTATATPDSPVDTARPSSQAAVMPTTVADALAGRAAQILRNQVLDTDPVASAGVQMTLTPIVGKQPAESDGATASTPPVTANIDTSMTNAEFIEPVVVEPATMPQQTPGATTDTQAPTTDPALAAMKAIAADTTKQPGSTKPGFAPEPHHSLAESETSTPATVQANETTASAQTVAPDGSPTPALFTNGDATAGAPAVNPLSASSTERVDPNSNTLVTQPQTNSPAHIKISLPVDHSRWSEALSARIAWQVSEGVQQAHVELNPPELGPVGINIEISDGQAKVHFQAQHPLARESLQDALPRLREMLSQTGLTLTDANVSQWSSGQGHTPGQQTQQQPMLWDPQPTTPEASSRAAGLKKIDNSLIDAYV